MPLNEQQIQSLLSAIREYNYPAVLYNFRENNEILFGNMRELEGYLKEELISREIERLKFALANIVYWGNISAGYYSYRVERFLNEITENKLQAASILFANIAGDSLMKIKKIKLPQFSNMSFASKMRMFLDPENYVTLDRKLLKIKRTGIHTVFDDVSEQPTYIPINHNNCKQYRLWSLKCKNAANTYFGNRGIIAVDVERGIFKMVDKGRIYEAATILANM